ncbi:MAG: 2-amino-4-hydroxy-6-hydroxymethyldihydropteridine diphosphokinase [Bacteroidaceae bacterium]|nr:2-amino-4-hydroxy-6-hydroxymethyldihydropteridine diphosphokinase [Bacteroidaceae bacterium]
MTHKLYLGLGSNLGNREENIRRALALIDERLGSVYRVSSFVETKPIGFSSPNHFINAACLVHTMMSPQACLRETQKIERELGRTQKSTLVDGELCHYDRIIDIDLLTYDDLHVTTPELTLPHPRMCERPFVMVPLEEIRQ